MLLTQVKRGVRIITDRSEKPRKGSVKGTGKERRPNEKKKKGRESDETNSCNAFADCLYGKSGMC